MAFYKKMTIIITWLVSTTIVGCSSRHSTIGSVTNPVRKSIRDELTDALKDDDRSRVKAMIDNGKIQSDQPLRGDKHLQTPLHRAASVGAVNVVELLIDDMGVGMAPEDIRGFTPLHLAALYGHVEVVKKLIKKNGELTTIPDKEHHMAIHRVIKKHKSEELESKRPSEIREELVRILLGIPRGINIDKAIIDEMVEARVGELEESGWPEWFQRLSNQLESMGDYAAIHLVAKNGPLGAAKDILDKGKAMRNNQGGRNGSTPLHLAAQGKQAEIVSHFLRKGAEYTKLDEQDRTFLHHATACLETVTKALEDRRVRNNLINIKDKDGRTPLHHAVINGDLEVVTHLVENGADVCAEDEYKLTPIFLARKKRPIKNYLLSKGFEVIPWYRMIFGPCCGRSRSCVKSCTENLAKHIEDFVCFKGKCCSLKVKDPCRLLYKILCCDFNDQQEESHRLLPR